MQAIATLPRDAARMLAVEILLADPESLGDDVLESCLYLLRERLRADAEGWTRDVKLSVPAACPGPGWPAGAPSRLQRGNSASRGNLARIFPGRRALSFQLEHNFQVNA